MNTYFIFHMKFIKKISIHQKQEFESPKSELTLRKFFSISLIDISYNRHHPFTKLTIILDLF